MDKRERQGALRGPAFRRPRCTISHRVTTPGWLRLSAVRQFYGSDPPPPLREALERNAGGVFRFFQDTVRQTDAPPLQVNVRIIDGEKRFEAYRNRRAPGLTTNSGFLGDTPLWLNEGLFEDAALPRERCPGSLRGPAPAWRTWLGAARPQALSL